MKKSVGFVVAAAVAVGLLVAGYFATMSRTQAPEVAFTLLDGSKHTTAQWRGKVVLVNFWATSCVTCVKEMPQMVQTYNKYKDRGLDFVAVAMSYDPPAYVVNFTESRKLPFKVAIDHSGSVAQGFDDTKITPTTFLLDKRGAIVKRYVGEPDFAALHQLVEKLLAES
jgi:peroxiredoxin